MKINITLFFQITNFWITYFFLHKLLFKPIIERFELRKVAREHLLKELKKREVVLEQKISEKRGLLEDFRTYLKKQYHVSKYQRQAVSSDIRYVKDEEEIEHAAQDIKKIIIKQVPHAY